MAYASPVFRISGEVWRNYDRFLFLVRLAWEYIFFKKQVFFFLVLLPKNEKGGHHPSCRSDIEPTWSAWAEEEKAGHFVQSLKTMLDFRSTIFSPKPSRKPACHPVA